jgi:hypothetical protein
VAETIQVLIDDEPGTPSRSRRPSVEELNERAQRAEAAAAAAHQQTRIHQQNAARAWLGNIAARRDAERAELEAARAAYRHAMEAGDFDAAGQAQEAIATATARQLRLEEHEASLKQPMAPAQSATGDPVEDYCSRLTPKSASFVRANPEFARDARNQARLTSAHYAAIADGHDAESPGYFEHVERAMEQETRRGSGSAAGGGMRHVRRGSPELSGVNKGDPSTHILNDGSVFLTENERRVATDGTLTWGPNRYGHKPDEPLGLQE